jgi:hypothetical protein
VAFLPACMTTSGRIHGEFLRLLYFMSNKQAVDYFEALGYDAHIEEFCHRRGVFFHLKINSPPALIPTSLTSTSATLVTSVR